MRDHERTIPLACPTCAGENFSFNEEEDVATRSNKCADCGMEYTYEEIRMANSARIDAAVDEIKDDVMREVRKTWKKMFRRS